MNSLVPSTEPTALVKRYGAEPVPVTSSEGRLIRDDLPLDVQTMTVEQLAMLLGRRAASIRSDVTRNPQALPPVFRPPHTRKILFRIVDVQRWMHALAELERHRREAAAAAARSFNVPYHPKRRDLLGKSKYHLRNQTTPLVVSDAKEIKP